MPIYRWPKEHAVLLTKTARVIVPVVIVAVTVAVREVIGWLVGSWPKKEKG